MNMPHAGSSTVVILVCVYVSVVLLAPDTYADTADMGKCVWHFTHGFNPYNIHRKHPTPHRRVDELFIYSKPDVYRRIGLGYEYSWRIMLCLILNSNEPLLLDICPPAQLKATLGWCSARCCSVLNEIICLRPPRWQFFSYARKKDNNSPGSPKLTIEIRCDSFPCLTLMLDFAVLNTTTGRDGFRSTWRKLPGRWPSQVTAART